MNPKFGVVVFPGSNCDHDAYYSLKKNLGFDTQFLWHKNHSINNSDVIILPGGFSYGDYLRSGAIAKLSPLMNEVREFAEKGGIVIGICNGFQILCESNLLPGTLIKNKSLKFVCRDVYVKVTNESKVFSSGVKGEVFKIPIAHGEGNYFIEEKGLNELKQNSQILFQYCDKNGNITEASNPNGSIENIAGIMSKKGNVLGMMPHPERVCSDILGNSSGKFIFNSIKFYLKNI